MGPSWIEIESFNVYPAGRDGTLSLDMTFLDVRGGTRSTVREVPVRVDDDGHGVSVSEREPWTSMPAAERDLIESRLNEACREMGLNLTEIDRPETVLVLPRARKIVPEVGQPGKDREVDDVSPPFVPPFERNWERLFDGELSEPVDSHVVFAGADIDVIGTVNALGRGLRVLDVGCSAGVTGEYAKKVDPDMEWVGLDVVEAAVREAAGRLDAAHLVDIEHDPIPYCPNYFDVAICSQLLEHLYNPWAAARKIVDVLKDGGTFICSVPHGGHVAIIAQMLEGRYPLSASGPLDITHLRVFTAETILQLVEKAGCQPIMLTRSMFRMTRYDESLMAGLLDAASRAGLDCSGYAADGWTVGFTVVARKQDVTVARRTSLVRRSERALNENAIDEACRLLTIETSMYPQNALAFVRLARILSSQSRYSDAADTLGRCIERHPGYLPARYELIRALNHAGETDKALAEFDTAVGMNAKFFMSLQNIFV